MFAKIDAIDLLNLLFGDKIVMDSQFLELR